MGRPHFPPKTPGSFSLGLLCRTHLQLLKNCSCRSLSRFKERFPEWYTASWSNSVLTVTESDIEIGHVGPAGYVCDFRAPPVSRHQVAHSLGELP